MVQSEIILLIYENHIQPSQVGYCHKAKRQYFPVQFISFHLVVSILRYIEFSAMTQNRVCPSILYVLYMYTHGSAYRLTKKHTESVKSIVYSFNLAERTDFSGCTFLISYHL